jgi:hypothetical protein
VTGYRTPEPGSRNTVLGLSAHVLDRAYNCALIASFRSEDTVPTFGARGRLTGGARLGHDGARARAVALADALNWRFS